MFFPERIRSIRSTDRVLEIGPGASPFPRSDVLLELEFASEAEAYGQRGRLPLEKVDPRTVFYDGGRFPFDDQEFDYVICSHVLEHVEDVPFFILEINRVAKRGYLEFPLCHYEYLYNIPEHRNLVYFDGHRLLWLPKQESQLTNFSAVQLFFTESLIKGYSFLVDQLRDFFFQGFEWQGSLIVEKAKTFSDICPKFSPESLPEFGQSKWMQGHVLITTQELNRLQANELRLNRTDEQLRFILGTKEVKLGRFFRKLLRRHWSQS